MSLSPTTGRSDRVGAIRSLRDRLAEADPAELLLMLLTLVALGIALKVAITAPLGTAFDELAHYSFLRATAEHPRLLADHDAMRMLDPTLGAWTDEPNYITHPPLYYLVMTPLAAIFPTSPLPIRLVDAALAVAGFVLAGLGGLSRLTDPRARVLFVAAVFGPPASIGVAGLVNNDDLMAFEIGLLFFLLARQSPRAGLLALVLAALGWTKLTGFVAGALLVGFVHLLDLVRRRSPLISRRTGLLLLGVAIGAIPTIANLVTYGRPVWTPAAFPAWFETIPPGTGLDASLLGFTELYLGYLGERLAYRPELFGALPLLIGLLGAPYLAANPIATADDFRNRTLAVAGLATITLFLTLHFGYAWASLRTSGSLADLQPRYFLAVWPVLALTLALGVAALPRQLARGVAAAFLVGLAIVSAPAYSLIRLVGLG